MTTVPTQDNSYIKLATILVIVCAIAFLALWAIPTLLEKVNSGSKSIQKTIQPVAEKVEKEIKANEEDAALEKALSLIQENSPEYLIQKEKLLYNNWYGPGEPWDLALTVRNTDTGESVDMHYELSYENGKVKINHSSTVAEMYE